MSKKGVAKRQKLRMEDENTDLTDLLRPEVGDVQSSDDSLVSAAPGDSRCEVYEQL